jgi:hypothetical protein
MQNLTVNQSRSVGIGSSPRGGAKATPKVAFVVLKQNVMFYFVYILYSARLSKYYIGRTENLELRLQFHNDPLESRKFTARGIPWVPKFPCHVIRKMSRFDWKPSSKK